MKIAYPAKFETGEEGRVLVRFRDLPEAATDGADMEEARVEAKDLLDSALMFRMKYREPIPAPSIPDDGEILIAPDAAVAMKAALRIAMCQSNMTVAELARRLNVDYREAQRIANPHHATRIARLSEAIDAAGYHAVIEVEPLPTGGA